MNFNFKDFYQIKSDVSQKKIYRCKNLSEKKILVDFSYNHSDYASYLEVNSFLSNINISVPKIFETDESLNLIFMEDFGNSRYDSLIKNIEIKDFLLDSINSLIEIQNTNQTITKYNLKRYNFSTFIKEISEFADFYLPIKNISKDIADEFVLTWKSEFENFNINWNSFVHKDFELQNLMHLPERKGHLKCGILDFQNAFIGFSGWDVFSLLESPRIYFEDKYNDELIEHFYNKTKQDLPFSEFLQQYYFFNTARQSRIIGRWINLDKKNQNYNYSKYLGTTLKRLKKSLYYLQNRKISNLYDTIIF